MTIIEETPLLPYAFEHETQGIVMLQASDVRYNLTVPVDLGGGQVECRVCGKHMKRGGYGPHSASHLRAIGDLPQQKQPKRKPKAEPKPKAVKVEAKYEPSTRDVCVAMLFGLVGIDACIPMSELDEVLGWIDCTEQLVDRLRQAGTK